MDQARDLVEEFTQLAQSDLAPREFYKRLLPRLASHLNAVGMAVWTCSEDSIEPLWQHEVDGAINDAEGGPSRHRSLLQKVQAARQPAFVLPKSMDEASSLINPTEFLLSICPIKDDETVVALLESFHSDDVEPGDREAGLRVLRTFAGIAAKTHRNFELRQLRERENWWIQFDEFTQAAHSSLHPIRTAYAIANEGRRVVRCDRMTVVLCRGAKCKVAAISGLDSVDRRANMVVLLEELASRVLAMREPLVHPTHGAELPPQLSDAVDAYVDNSRARFLTVAPLFESETSGPDKPAEPVKTNVIGALVAEQFAGDPISQELVDAVGQQASSALSNAIEHHRVFLLPLWAAVGRLSWIVTARNLPKTIAVVLLVMGVVFFLSLFPVKFELTAEGTLQPESRRHVFAESDGVIDLLEVQHGSLVSEGHVLAKLRSSEMDLQLADIRGELETTRKKLAATKAARVSSSSATGKDQLLVNQMAAEEEELREWLANLRHQQQLLIERKESLLARSPIKGEVITWDLENLLTARPVAKGDILMTVADTEGAWVVESLLLDRRVGHLRDALRDFGDELEVEYILATNPGVKLKGKIKKVAKSTIMDETYGLSLPVTIDITESDIEQLRPGAKVSAKIDCGKRSIGYVWLHEVFEFIQSRVLFRL